MDALIPPAPPARVEARQADDGIVVSWQGTGTDVDQFYKVYRKTSGEECWQAIGIQLIEGDNKGGYLFNVPLDERADEYAYAVTTVDIYGNESELSQVVEP